MKRNLLSLAGLFCVLLTVNSQSIGGTWIFNNGNFPVTLLLLNNGTGEFQGMPIKFKTQDGKIYIDDGVKPLVYNYQLLQTTLTLSGGDLHTSIIFSRSGSSQDNSTKVYQNTSQSTASTNNIKSIPTENVTSMAGNSNSRTGSESGLIGIWQGQQGMVVFYPDRTLIYNGTAYQFSASGNSITITGTDGSTIFTYTMSGNQLKLSQKANSATYTKKSLLKPDIIDQQLVGKWCIMSNSYNSYSGGGSGSEECITLNADGSYIYYYSASRSVSNGSSVTQDSDRGSWKTDGLTLVSVSQTSGKTTRYTLTKENAQNGDASIVVGGRRFITAYNRQGW